MSSGARFSHRCSFNEVDTRKWKRAKGKCFIPPHVLMFTSVLIASFIFLDSWIKWDSTRRGIHLKTPPLRPCHSSGSALTFFWQCISYWSDRNHFNREEEHHICPHSAPSSQGIAEQIQPTYLCPHSSTKLRFFKEQDNWFLCMRRSKNLSGRCSCYRFVFRCTSMCCIYP